MLFITIHSTASGRLISWTSEEEGSISWWSSPVSYASAHILIPRTAEEVWRCVPDKDTAWTVEGLNTISLNLEFAHRLPGADDLEERVTDSQLQRGAWQVAWWCLQYDIPAERTVNIDLYGIIGHADIPPAYNTGGHWDPGPYFDWDTFMRYVLQWKALLS